MPQQPQVIQFNGEVHQFPADWTQAQIAQALQSYKPGGGQPVAPSKPSEPGILQKLFGPTFDAIGEIPGGIKSMVSDPSGFGAGIVNNAAQHMQQVPKDFQQGNYGDMFMDAVGSAPFMGPMVDQTRKAGNAFETGDFAGGVGNLGPVLLAVLGGGLGKTGRATEGVGPAMADMGLQIPKSIRKDFGSPGETLVKTRTLPSNAAQASLQIRPQIEAKLKAYDVVNGPQVDYPLDINNAAEQFTYDKLKANDLGLGKEQIKKQISDAYLDYDQNAQPMTLLDVYRQKLAEGGMANWVRNNQSQIQQSPVANTYRQGVTFNAKKTLTDAVPSVSADLETQQGLMGGAEAYSNHMNSPHTLQKQFELATLPLAFAGEHFFGPGGGAAGLIPALGSFAMRSPNFMTGTGITVDMLRRALLNDPMGYGLTGVGLGEEANKTKPNPFNLNVALAGLTQKR